MGLSNNLLLGDPGDFTCLFGCPGQATLYDVLRFTTRGTPDS